jgi:hypothetical protein
MWVLPFGLLLDLSRVWRASNLLGVFRGASRISRDRRVDISRRRGYTVIGNRAELVHRGGKGADSLMRYAVKINPQAPRDREAIRSSLEFFVGTRGQNQKGVSALGGAYRRVGVTACRRISWARETH